MGEDTSNDVAGKGQESEVQRQRMDSKAPLKEKPKEISIYDHWSPQRRTVVLTLVSLSTLLLPMTDTIYLPSIVYIQADLQTTAVLVSATISAYTLMVGLMPLFWGPLADYIGRKKTILISVSFYIVATVLCLIAPNIVSLIIFRALEAAGVASTIVVGSGVISDIYPPHLRGPAFGIFGIPPLIGPIVGPVLGGAIATGFGWRGVFVLLGVLAVIVVGLTIIFVPETLHYIVLSKDKAEQEKKQKENQGNGLTNVVSEDKKETNGEDKGSNKEGSNKEGSNKEGSSASESEEKIEIEGDRDPEDSALVEIIIPEKPRMLPPWRPLFYLRDPMVAYLAWISGVGVCTLYIMVIVLPSELQYQYGLNQLQVGLCYLPFGVGAMVGSNVGGKITEYFYNKNPVVVESQLVGSMIGISLIMIGGILFGWTTRIHLACPLTFSCVVGFGLTTMFPGVFNYCILKQPMNAGAITAATQFVQFALSAVGILAGQSALNSIGAGPLFTILAAILLVSLIPGIIVIRWFLGNSYVFGQKELEP